MQRRETFMPDLLHRTTRHDEPTGWATACLGLAILVIVCSITTTAVGAAETGADTAAETGADTAAEPDNEAAETPSPTEENAVDDADATDPSKTEPLGDKSILPWDAEAEENRIYRPPTNAREQLDYFEVDESHLRMFMDGQPLGPNEDESLFMVLYHFARFDVVDMEQWTKTNVPLPRLAKHPETHRAQLFKLRGRVQMIDRVKLPDEVAERYEFGGYYLVGMQLDDSPYRAVICARKIPRAWIKAVVDGRAIDERASVTGLFLKTGGSGSGRPELVFAARRVAWHPDRADAELGVTPGQVLLGEADMDVGLFDNIRDRKPLLDEDRECFYQVLAATGKIGDSKLQLVSNDQYDLGAMLNAPRSQRGRLFTVRGSARRISKIRVDDPDIQKRFGIDHYYEVNFFVSLEQKVRFEGTDKVFPNTYPLVACVRELPEGMPEGEGIREPILITGCFLKLYAYPSQYMSAEDKTLQQQSPMFIGAKLQWLPEPPARNLWLELTMGGLFVVVLAGIWVGVWRYTRGDRAFERSTLLRQFEVEEGKSLNEMGIESETEPDFSRLHEHDESQK